MNKKIESEFFNDKDCKKKIKAITEFYNKTTDFYKESKEQELNLWRDALESCTKKKCEPGNYELYGKCVPY